MACYRRRGARTGGTAWRGRRRRWRWARRTGRCPGAWPACARPRHRPRTRARILLLRDSGETPGPVAERVGLAADGVRLCAARYPGGGVEHALSDGARSGRPRETGDADRAFVVEDSLPDAAQHPGLQQRRARGEDPALPRGGGRQAGRLQMEVEPVGHRLDGRGARRGYPPPGWGGQGKLVAGSYTSRSTTLTSAM